MVRNLAKLNDLYDWPTSAKKRSVFNNEISDLTVVFHSFQHQFCKNECEAVDHGDSWL